MFRSLLHTYRESFAGLSSEIWWLALVTFINRAGTMVIPFMSLYLTEELNFTLSQVGWIMAAFGLGSLAGSWIGGKLTDSIGYYSVMFRSLLTTGFLFITLQFITSFWGFFFGVLITMTVADSFRPAMFVSLKAYSKPENLTRSLTLIRLAINLGFSFGPFLGGLIILSMGYKGLFWVDGITCILAIVLFRFILKKKAFENSDNPDEHLAKPQTVYKDKPYWLFLVIVFLMGFVFMQLFSTIPLFYKNIHGLSELQIGLLLSLNGMLIFLTEMPLIHKLDQSSIDKIRIITWSLLLLSLSYLVLNLTAWTGILIVSIVLITLGEMMAFPFANAFAMTRAIKGKEGQYMALYSMAFSSSHIFSPKTGMEVIDRWGYASNWYLLTMLSLVAVVLCFWLYRLVR